MMTSPAHPCSAQENRSEFFPMIRVTDTIVLDDREINERFVRATGPGAQNVNKGYGRLDRPGAY